jgi:hypothetical protein
MLVIILAFSTALLVVALTAVTYIWTRANSQLKRYDSIDDLESYKSKCLAEANDALKQSEKIEKQINEQKVTLKKYVSSVGVIRTTAEAKSKLDQFTSELERVRNDIGILEETASMHEVGFYQRRFDYDHPDEYRRKLSECAANQKSMIKAKSACFCETEWHVEGSATKGKKMVNEQIKLMLRAFNGECDAAIAKVRHSNINTIGKRINKCYEALNKLGATKQISLSEKFLHFKLQELYLTHEHEVVKQEEKERQREMREQIREEQKAEKEIADATKKAERDEAVKEKALADARKMLNDEHGKHNQKLQSLVEKLEFELQEAIERKAKAIARAQLTKSGHVYVLSNVGCFGENVFKIGMSRRLEPLERVKELGGASVPFPFDVHAMIFTENAPALETALHQRFDFHRVNLINTRREFFRVSLDEIMEAVAELHGLVTFKKDADAEQFRETVAKRKLEMANTA